MIIIKSTCVTAGPIGLKYNVICDSFYDCVFFMFWGGYVFLAAVTVIRPFKKNKRSLKIN